MTGVCIIPARGGSKRIPRKNIKEFCGQPMIAWSLQAAQASGCFERIIVSTDDTEIAQVAEEYGAEVPFRRSAGLADDHAGTAAVIRDAIQQLGLAAQTPVCCLYATAPFISADDLREGLAHLKQGDAAYVLAVTSFAYPIQRALRRSSAGQVEMFEPQHLQSRSQDLTEAWHDAGQFYWANAETWNSGQDILAQGAYGIALPRYRVQDIDTFEDWRCAELNMRALLAETKP